MHTLLFRLNDFPVCRIIEGRVAKRHVGEPDHAVVARLIAAEDEPVAVNPQGCHLGEHLRFTAGADVGCGRLHPCAHSRTHSQERQNRDSGQIENPFFF